MTAIALLNWEKNLQNITEVLVVQNIGLVTEWCFRVYGLDILNQIYHFKNLQQSQIAASTQNRT